MSGKFVVYATRGSTNLVQSSLSISIPAHRAAPRRVAALTFLIYKICYIHSMQSAEIRQKFLDFFQKRGHVAIPSASLVPSNDSSVLFTTAGMQQFKAYYVGQANALKDFGSLNVTSSQKCVRTSDIEEVGDESHLTFFEMLGNFSFGGYWKKEAIE